MSIFVKIQTIKTAIFVKIQTFRMRTVGGVDTAIPVVAGHKQHARHVWERAGRDMYYCGDIRGVSRPWRQDRVSRPVRRGRRRTRGSRALASRRG